MTVYCDLCKFNHCGQKAVNLFPEDKVKWALFENGELIDLFCDTHKRMYENMVEPWHFKLTFVKVNNKDLKAIKK